MKCFSGYRNGKLRTLNEAGTHLIEENVVLPKEIFSSYWNYLLYEMAHCKPIMVLLSVITTLGVLITLFHNNDACSIIFGISLFISSLVLLVVVLSTFADPITEQDFVIKLSVEVIARKPVEKAWGTVAYNMNQYLFMEGLWHTPYYFYSGKKCHGFFTTLTKKVNSSSYSDFSSNSVEDTQSPVSAEKTTNGPNKFDSIRSDPILMTYISKAIEVEKEAQREYWRTQYPDADLP
ncbi:CPI_1c_G0000790.mRNA.1.CDS.1 [Saccharomyces cerevisiae]|nr:CPI_1c_G0000790.mRNA.1.CDS.1 [Saccharomyces cerevisiae]CAI7130057.1 CPI_1c_G0000790.mRNA.1.CDS.1 [Saccharomyces cerevisiae]